MSKAFTRENRRCRTTTSRRRAPPLPAGTRNYMTPGGFARLSAELEQLVKKERPELVATVAWAAANGDRSENGDYIYGKKRLREIDRRIRFLIRRLDAAEVVDPLARRDDAETPTRCSSAPRSTVADAQRRASARSASSASTRSTRRAATSAGCRRWRARSQGARGRHGDAASRRAAIEEIDDRRRSATCRSRPRRAVAADAG